MTSKVEEVNTSAPDSAPTTAVEPSVPTEKQPETAPAAEAVEKKDESATKEKEVEDTTAGVADLSVKDKEEVEPKSEEKKVEEATAAVAAAPVPAPTEPADNKVPAPATESAPETSGPTWPETSADHPLTQFYDVFEEIVKDAGHAEVFGITLSKDSPFHTKLILQKFLRANQNDLVKAKEQLLDTLKWRKEFDPTKAAEEAFDKEKFGGLGYIIEVEGVPESVNKKDIATFNIYGAVKDNDKTFGDIDAFLRWRVGLMERSVQKLNLKDATEPIPNYNEGSDRYQGFQIHDYLQVSFLRRDPVVKAATKKTIEVLGRYYPETLSRKFFVNVPAVMGWVYTAIKMVLPKETVKKFTVVSYANQLAGELGQDIPKAYGGTKGELGDVGEGMKLA